MKPALVFATTLSVIIAGCAHNGGDMSREYGTAWKAPRRNVPLSNLSENSKSSAKTTRRQFEEKIKKIEKAYPNLLLDQKNFEALEELQKEMTNQRNWESAFDLILYIQLRRSIVVFE